MPVTIDLGTRRLVIESPRSQAVVMREGSPGPGVAVGGSVGQILTKTGADDYVTGWADAPAYDDRIASLEDRILSLEDGLAQVNARLDGLGKTYRGIRALMGQYTGSASVMWFGSFYTDVCPAGSVWQLSMRLYAQSDIANVCFYEEPVNLINCSVDPNIGDGCLKLFPLADRGDSWTPLPWTVTVLQEGKFSGEVQLTCTDKQAQWSIFGESSWLLTRIK